MHNVLKLNGYSDVFKRPIFVLGLPYGGGMKAAKLIHEMGVWTGRTSKGAISDPNDFFENRLIRDRLIKPTLKHMDCDPAGLQTLPSAKRLTNLVFPTPEGNIDLKEKLHRMLENQGYDHAQRWMYHDARLTLLWRSFLTGFPDADWVIVRQAQPTYIKSCLDDPRMFEVSSKARFWKRISQAYSERFDMLTARVEHVHEIRLENIEEGNLSELKLLSDKTGFHFNTKRKGSKLEQRRWRHS